MVGLVDLIAIKRKVPVRGQEVEVRGIDFQAIGQLILTTPEIKEFVASKGGSFSDITAEDLLRFGPKVVGIIIAAGCGEPGNLAAEKAAASLAIGEQVALLDAIKEATFPQGVGPFVAILHSWGLFEESGGDLGAFGWAPAMNSQKPSPPSPPNSDAASKQLSG